jgi:site-specific DNA-adenine methylase
MVLLINRTGSKKNDIKFFKDLLPMDVSIVVEPFGGSFQVIKEIYPEKKYKKIVNDLDNDLYYIYKNYDDYADMRIDMGKKLGHIEQNRDDVRKYLIDSKWDIRLKKYFLLTKRNPATGNFDLQYSEEDFNNQIKLFDSIKFTNKNYDQIIEKYRKNKNAFIFIDPPYDESYNDDYNADFKMDNILDYLFDVLNDKTTNAKIMITINKTRKTYKLFKNFVKKIYTKIYSIAKKKEKILVICNY